MASQRITQTVVLYFSMVSIGFLSLNFPSSTAHAENNAGKIDPRTQKLANTYIDIWKNPEARKQHLAELHRQNPEWDFMFRTYSVLSFVNLAIYEPQREKEYLKLIDIIIDDTLQQEKQHGFKYFLMRYGQSNNWKVRPPKSLFIDGEIALMLAARCIIQNNPAYSSELQRRIDLIVERMEHGPVLCAESYPDECWVFCNSIALAAVKISDQVNQTDHSKLFSKWISTAKKNFIDPKTGLLRSAFTYDGQPVQSAKGPEGSSIWMTCHMLQIIDKSFAQDQYKIARKELMASIMGFGYSREWPKDYPVSSDIDSGPVLPILNASPSASGLGLIAAASFNDKETFSKLTISLNTFAMPVEQDDCRYYQLSNPLGDVVILYGLTVGPIWEKISRHSETLQ